MVITIANVYWVLTECQNFFKCFSMAVSQFSHSVVSDSLQPHGLQHNCFNSPDNPLRLLLLFSSQGDQGTKQGSHCQGPRTWATQVGLVPQSLTALHTASHSYKEHMKCRRDWGLRSRIIITGQRKRSRSPCQDLRLGDVEMERRSCIMKLLDSNELWGKNGSLSLSLFLAPF